MDQKRMKYDVDDPRYGDYMWDRTKCELQLRSVIEGMLVFGFDPDEIRQLVEEVLPGRKETT